MIFIYKYIPVIKFDFILIQKSFDKKYHDWKKWRDYVYYHIKKNEKYKRYITTDYEKNRDAFFELY